jgi:formylglycine-generating enzyme required for sulfatase activity
VAVAPKPETPSAVKEAVPQKPGRLPTGWTAETKRVKVATPEGEQEKDITYYTNTIGMKFVLVPSGEFIMGSPEGEDPVKARLTKSDEVPQHQVKITHPFYEGAHEVTQEQYERIMGKNPSYDTGVGSRNNPVDCVSWKDATEFCTRLSEKEGIKYRLPTEAEWEYACRAGSKTRYCFSNEDRFLSDYAWYRDNSRRTTHPVGQKSPNAWGIYDVHGNVCEWCQDGYDPEYYAKSPIKDPQGPPLADTPDAVARGGSWTSYAQTHRCACRWRAARSRGNEYIGFRVVCEAPGPSKATAPTTPASGAAPATPAAATKTQEPAPPPVAPAVPAESVASASQPKAPSASMPSGTPEKATAPPQPIEKTYDRAINFLGENIVREIVRNDLLVALVFDESKSLLEDRKVVMSKLEHLVADLRKELKPREAARLKWSVLSYSQKPTLWLAPTSNMEEVTETAKKIKVDESGVENVCATLSYTGKTLAPLGKKMCVVLITDEEGSDAHDEKAFRQAADDLQASKAKLIVFGRESQFQQGNAFAWLRDSNNQRVGPWYWSQRGIESCEQEFFATDWLFNRHRSGRVIGSGFGCWSLTTLAELTKGAFFITGEAPSTYDYKMDKFKPEWVLPEEYAKRTASSKLRTTIRKVIDEWTKFDPPPSLYKLDQLKAECEEAITKGEKALKFVEGAIDEMEGLRVRRSTERFARQRWQANYDLVLAELYKFRFMLRDYVAVLRDTRTNGFPKSKPGDKFNYYRILYDTNLKEPHTGPRGVKEWEQAKKAFDQVISDYAGTPWAEVAKFEKQATAPISISPSYDVQPTRPK